MRGSEMRNWLAYTYATRAAMVLRSCAAVSISCDVECSTLGRCRALCTLLLAMTIGAMRRASDFTNLEAIWSGCTLEP